MNQRNITFASFLLTATLHHPLVQAESNVDYSVNLIANYSEASKPIRVLDKNSSFRTGGAGLKFKASHNQFGTVYVGGGSGYSPNETASFLGANISGSAKSIFYNYGYSYKYQLSEKSQLVFAGDYVDYAIEGDFSGDRAGVPVAAKITSDISMADISMAWRHSLSDQFYVSLGLGSSRWKIDALAKGSLGDSIRASTQASADGTDPLAFIRAEFNLLGLPLNLRYQQSELNADNRVMMRSIYLQIRLPL